MLFKISSKNIFKRFKDYAIYFVTLILGVAIFYIFNSIESQTIFMNVSSNKREIIDLMMQMLSGISVFVSFILGFLIIYASNFFMKRRNKEFGIYLTLGMSKKKISKIILIETILIGLVSLVLGLLLGIVLSQFTSGIVASMFEASMDCFAFVFSKAAVIKTIIYFGIMYLIVMLFNTWQVNRFKLIDLLQAQKKSEKVKIKNPIISALVFILSVAILAYCYYTVTSGLENVGTEGALLKIIALGAISTFTLFWSLSGMMLKIFMHNKKRYYKGLNSFTLRQISSKVNTMVFSVTVICLMLFVTICVLSSSFSIKNSMTNNLKELTPVDIKLDKKRNSENPLFVAEALDQVHFDYKKDFTDIITFPVYATDDLTLKDTVGTYAEELIKMNKFMERNLAFAEKIIKIGDYNKVAKLYGQKTYDLKNNEYMIIGDYPDLITIRNEGLKRNTKITLAGQTLQPKYNEVQNGFVDIAANHVTTGIVLVPDHMDLESIVVLDSMIANYKGNNDAATEEKVMQFSNNETLKQLGLEMTTKQYIYENSVGLGAMITFIGLYIGIIFLISSAAILALKELSESTDNKERFLMLRKLGVDDKMINKALFKQIGVFFLVPLTLALIHSIFGIIFANSILSSFGSEQMLESVFLTAVFILLIYGGYFLITYFTSKNIIKEK
ncbi:MAG: FtsX-like permease family protein [Bacilli bacterium]|nr:FtsX-like permease family protein [Bacilli bacterium]